MNSTNYWILSYARQQCIGALNTTFLMSESSYGALHWQCSLKEHKQTSVHPKRLLTNMSDPLPQIECLHLSPSNLNKFPVLLSANFFFFNSHKSFYSPSRIYILQVCDDFDLIWVLQKKQIKMLLCIKSAPLGKHILLMRKWNETIFHVRLKFEIPYPKCQS